MRLPLSLAAVTLAAASACSTTRAVQQPEARPAEAPAAAAAPAAETAKVTSAADPKLEGADALAAALRDLRDISVFFKTDDATLSEDAKSKLATIGKLLEQHKLLKVRIEGNCDERGTPEHNLALGQRRATVARAYLATMGARDEQMQTVSLGDERPRVAGHDESAWQQNRRDDLVAIETHE